MTDKLLGPNGKMYTMAQLERMSIKKVFDILIELGVANNGQYREFREPKKRRRSRSRSRSRGKKRSRPRSKRGRSRGRKLTRYVVIYPGRSGRSRSRSRRWPTVRPGIAPPRRPSGYRTDCDSKGYYSCVNSNQICRWNQSRGKCQHR